MSKIKIKMKKTDGYGHGHGLDHDQLTQLPALPMCQYLDCYDNQFVQIVNKNFAKFLESRY